MEQKEENQDDKAEKALLRTESKKNKKLFFAGVLFLTILFFGSPILGFAFPSTFGKIFYPVLRRVNYPMTFLFLDGIEHQKITSKEVLKNLDAVRKFYLSQDFSSLGMRTDFSTGIGKKRLEIKEKQVFNKLVENKMIQMIGNSKGVFVSDEDVEQYLKKKFEKNNGRTERELELNLKGLYGWNLEEYKKTVLITEVYFNKLLEIFKKQAPERESYHKILQIKEKLNEKPEDFYSLAKEHSQALSKENDGKIGWLSESQMLGSLIGQVSKMEKGQISEVLVSELGYHIIKLENVRQKEGENASVGEKEYEISQILIRDDGFSDWLKNEKRKIKVVNFNRKYKWSEDEVIFQFSSEKDRKTEAGVLELSNGDPSVN